MVCALTKISFGPSNGWYVQVPGTQNFCFFFSEIVLLCIVSSRQEGRFAIVTTREAGCDGRVWLAALDAPTNDADANVKSCGLGAPMLALSSRVMIPRMTVANKPGTPGRARIIVKAIAQGRPG
jgi:hypothetical protein